MIESNKVLRLPYLLAEKLYSLELSLARSLHIIPSCSSTIRQTIIHDRHLEYSFVLQNLECPKGAKVLDVGFVGSGLPFFLVSLGYDTYGVDIRKFPVRYPFNFFREDIRHTSFPDEYFDRIIAVSTLEHIGLKGSFGSDQDPKGDRKAINEMSRILKQNGKMLITLPYGKAMIVPSRYRIYDDSQLARLIKSNNLKVEKTEYYKEIEDENGFMWWRPALKSKVRNTVGFHAVVALKLIKA